MSSKIESKQGEKWWFSGVYGIIRYRNRDEFWEELDGVYGLCCPNLVRCNREIRSSRIIKSMTNFNLLFLEQNFGIWMLFREVLVCSRIDRFLTRPSRNCKCWFMLNKTTILVNSPYKNLA